jgi:hypothetical protein
MRTALGLPITLRSKGYRCLAVLLLSGVSAMSIASQIVSFASGRASVPFPESFKVVTSDDGLVATFGGESDHIVELSLLGVLPKAGGKPNQAVDFIHSQGKKKGAQVSSDGERAVFSEPGAQHRKDGKVFQAMHWQIGVGNCIFTMTLTAPLPMSKELDAFLGEPLNAVVNKLSCAS